MAVVEMLMLQSFEFALKRFDQGLLLGYCGLVLQEGGLVVFGFGFSEFERVFEQFFLFDKFLEFGLVFREFLVLFLK
jgi:hypothetical protein